MNSKKLLIGLMLMPLGVLLLVAFGLIVVNSAILPLSNPSDVIAGRPDAQFGRDAVLEFVRAKFEESAPAADIFWIEELTSPGGFVGSSSYRYTSGDWVATISFPGVAPESIIYLVAVTNQTTGFKWEGWRMRPGR